MSHPTLIARDPKTYRRLALVMATGWDQLTDPGILAQYIASLSVSIGRSWLERYGVPFPLARIEWTIRDIEHPAQLGGG